ncbi:hypothetical protein CH373_15775 [Leptospira perolatii]|uniref:Uncharacterized protein n=2 Tax=Leptospira perolatii TaxID=2023191 RepID=A0A2M9ZJG3_9LEPT|nr:hypothetical protein [Leptospira perolatii]PJZ68869.1 hypothetical protein CH360_14235 [Leptospira perolatii]PJZ72200.1 hypothetical protein CH373_15775 [Leptospira perolatii]
MREIVFLFLWIPFSLSAEVMDKEPAFSEVWLWALAMSALAFFGARYKPWSLLLILPIAGAYSYSLLLEVTDPFAGPAILAEAGVSYVLTAWISPILVLGAAFLGFWFRKLHKSV